MAKYSIAKNAVAASTTQDYTTFQTAASSNSAGGVIKLYEVSFSGHAGSTNVQGLAIARGTSPVTPGTSQTPTPLSPSSPAAAGVYHGTQTALTNWATAPTLGGIILSPTFNAFGGVYRWVAPPDSEVFSIATNAVVYLSIGRSTTGTNTLSAHFLFEEL